MENKVSNISFTSKIRFVPSITVDKIIQKTLTVPVTEMFEVNHVKKINKTGATKRVLYCVAGLLKDIKYKENKIFHWFPNRVVDDTYPCKCRSEKLKLAMSTLSEKNEYKGFLIGGILRDHPFENWLSAKMINLLKRGFKHVEKKDFTMFFSQDAKNIKNLELHVPESSFVYCEKNDTYYVNCKKYIYNDLDNYQDESGVWHDLLDKNEIRNHFEYISVSPNDRVFAGGEEVPKSFWDKNKHKH